MPYSSRTNLSIKAGNNNLQTLSGIILLHLRVEKIEMKISGFTLTVFAALAVVSCGPRKQAKRFVIPYVENILSDTTSVEYRAVAANDPHYEGGTISVLGTPTEVIDLTEQFLNYDQHDNISGKKRSDKLPDFSGETFSLLLDMANSPYKDYISMNNDEFLKEINVRNFLFAIDTNTCTNPLDLTTLSYKRRSKAVVFASSYSSAYGYFDVDSLCRHANAELAVFAPVQSMLEYSFAHFEKPLSLVIWSDSEKIGKGIYSSVIPEFFSSKHSPESGYQAFSPYGEGMRDGGSAKGRLLDLLDMYIATSGTQKISAILLDNSTVSVDELDAAVEEIMNSDEDKLLVYRNLLKKDFECVCPAKALAEQCYFYLRNKNAFTHRISYPDVKCFFTTPVSDLPDALYDVDGSYSYAYKYSRTLNNAFPSFAHIELRDKYFPADLMEYMEKNAPNTFSLYVR